MKNKIVINDTNHLIGGAIAAELRKAGIQPICSQYGRGIFERCIEKEKPDAVIIILFDAEKERRRIAEIKEKYPDMYIFTGIFRSGRRINRELTDSIADYSFSLPLLDEHIINYIVMKISGINNKFPGEIIEVFLEKCGFPSNLSGFIYLAAAVKICIDEPSLLSGGISEIYSRISEECRTTPELAERSLRTAAEKAMKNGSLPFELEKKPSNGELICLLCDYFVHNIK